MDEGLMFFLFFLVVAVVLVLAALRKHWADRAWAEAADELGFSRLPVTLLGQPKMWGDVGDARVDVYREVRGSGKQRVTYSCLDVRFPSPLGLGLKLSREGFLSSVGKLFGSQDIQVGDGAFDDALLVKGHDPKAVREFLTSARRARILRALGSYPELVIRDRGVSYEERGYFGRETIVSAVRRLSELAESLSHRRESDDLLAGAVEAQVAGQVEQALEKAQQAAQAGEGFDANMLAGEMLVLAGRDEEAAQAFAAAREQAPQDPEASRWAEAMTGTPAAPAAPAATAGGEVDTDVASVCQALFDPGQTGFESSRLFESSYAGRTVCWKGELERVERYNHDFVFG